MCSGAPGTCARRSRAAASGSSLPPVSTSTRTPREASSAAASGAASRPAAVAGSAIAGGAATAPAASGSDGLRRSSLRLAGVDGQRRRRALRRQVQRPGDRVLPAPGAHALVHQAPRDRAVGGGAVGPLDADVDVDRAQRAQRRDRAGRRLGRDPRGQQAFGGGRRGAPDEAVVVAQARAPGQRGVGRSRRRLPAAAGRRAGRGRRRECPASPDSMAGAPLQRHRGTIRSRSARFNRPSTGPSLSRDDSTPEGVVQSSLDAAGWACVRSGVPGACRSRVRSAWRRRRPRRAAREAPRRRSGGSRSAGRGRRWTAGRSW